MGRIPWIRHVCNAESRAYGVFHDKPCGRDELCRTHGAAPADRLRTGYYLLGRFAAYSLQYCDERLYITQRTHDAAYRVARLGAYAVTSREISHVALSHI